MGLAVITGGASGFGLALAQEAASAGLDVALLDRDGPRAMIEAQRLGGTFDVVAVGMQVDVADPVSIAASVTQVEDRWGHVDVLLSNVGVQLFGAVEHFTDEEWRWILDVNVIGSARIVNAFLPMLRRGAEKRVAFTISTSVLDVASRLGAYQASKFAVWGLAETLRLELAPDGIEVSVVFPSGMLSRHLESSEAAQPEQLKRPVAADDDLVAVMESNPAMAAMLATPEDAAAGVLEAVRRGDRYVITHGDLTPAISGRNEALLEAAMAANTRQDSKMT